MRNIALVGFMGSGKTEVGHALAKLLGVPFFDVDATVERSTGRSVREIFATEGEDRFRALEKAAILEASRGTGKVVSCGGGAVVDPENVRRLRENGTVVLLTADPEVLYRRVKDEGTRPLIDVVPEAPDEEESDRQARFFRLLRARGALYARAADHTVDTGTRSPGEIAAEIAEWLKETGRCD